MQKKYRKFLAMASTAIISLTSCGNTIQNVDPFPTEHTISRESSTADTSANPESPTSTETITSSVASDSTESSVTVSSTTSVSSESTTTTTTTTAPSVMRGNLYDCNNTLLMYSEKDEDGKEQRFTNDANKVAFANVLNEMSEGLDLTYDKQLRCENPTMVNGSRTGQSIQLTFDADIQNAIYNYMENTGIIGSAVVMRSDGSLLAEVSYPSYNPDDYYGVETEEDLAWGTYGNKSFQNFPPGSCFKIMSEVISDKHEMYSLYDEGTWYYDGTSIVNWDHDTNYSYPMQRSLYSAFINSSNIFFAHSFDNIGAEAVLDDLDTIFHFVSDINCDFGTISNNIEIYCNDDLRRSAFGQSYVMTCPIYLAALGREAAFGDMVKPFTIKNIVDTNSGEVIKSGSKDHDVIASIPKEYRQNLLDGMSGVGGNLGIYVPSGYDFYAKTGTAETWEGDFLYITGIVKKSTDNGSVVYDDYGNYSDSYIIVTQTRNPGAFGFSFASDSASLYQGVVNCVVGQ